jgi:hypothetical protein
MTEQTQADIAVKRLDDLIDAPSVLANTPATQYPCGLWGNANCLI